MSRPVPRHCRVLLAALATCALTGTLLAAPAVEIKTKLADITVEIDEALKTHPGLVADLLGEGKKWATKMRADAEKEKRETPELFQEGRRWSLERSYNSRSVVADRYVSVLRSDYMETGGAHPNTRVDTILWDRQAKKRISIRPFFKETADNGATISALAKLVQLAVVAEKTVRRASVDGEKKPDGTPEDWLRQDSQVREFIQPRLIKLGPVTLAPSSAAGKSSGLTVHFSPYDVDAYAAGPYTVFVPWTALKPYLSPEGAAIFEGERPAGDDQQ